MALKARLKIGTNPNSATQYITIPADIVRDSQYPFKPNDLIEVEVVPSQKQIIVRSVPKK